MVAEEILQPDPDEPPLPITMADLQQTPAELYKQSRTTKVWVELVINPVFYILMFCRASHEGEFPLHLLASQNMLTYFFAAGHHHYARYGMLYVEWMNRLHDDLHKAYMKGQSSVHLTSDLFNGM